MENRKRIIIIGGLSAGPSAAAKARRTDENAEIILFEKTANISYATCGIPYAFSGKIKDRNKLLVVKPELLRKRFNIDVHLEEPVINIDPDNHTVTTFKGEYAYDKLVYATGGSAITPPLNGLEQFENWAHAKTIEDFDRIVKSNALENANNITIIGAGLIGLETAENLVQIGKKVTIVELGKHILGPWDNKFATMGEKVLEDNGLRLELGKKGEKIEKDGTLLLNDGTSIPTDYLIMSIGVKPITEMLTSKGAKALPNGALIVNSKMETNLPDIYAAGDCASIPNVVTNSEGWFPMGTHSNKGGRVAGANAVGANEHFPGGYGTAIMEMFDHTIARTGAGPKILERENIPFESTFIIANSHPGFYPGGKDMFIEIYYTPETHVILGAELFGEKGVDKRTDVLATAIYAKLTIEDLPNLDLAYAPPFSPAKDPVIVAGFVAQNSQKGLYKEVNVAVAKEVFNTDKEITILDVRNPQELENTGIIHENALNIPLDTLRDNLEQIPTSKPIYITCAKGLRGYLASLILAHNGFKNLHNIAGGFTAWKKING
ncbi:FAD-dependent oxidoreductase [Flammeovirga kamogawensis]|uniref:FAD-dependent oxidoreductase n=1 Tax=Flammeovirga kamogawensis TaxID=373891 RepID=A0ABX8H1X6_9BACT|nr:FAD-dependent oxidoreductase [Flammeovirga kamogawensis]MBB6463783.1 NADPH-dependent 2,4-dienoyl-CoA reductase/sulfur reductase-like enzyme/rhodanese-related sulfurtransferase [Flammeovirga kamogawensis]QWG09708.1 FAD-dependent oxidoreductase [Flammeovirga kamogawensis]TRX65220.1 pyridine nucleotide-disulfide oxidoreductase [Flammeovirga kamogawensis]